MNGWVDAGSGEPVDRGLDPQAPMIHLGSLEFETQHPTSVWKNLQTDAQGRWTPVEPPQAPVPPSLYEVRRDALTAASNLTSSGGWMDAGGKTLEFAEKFEAYLLEVRDQ